MGRPVESAMFKVDMSHQEMERMLSELEEWYASSGAQWISAEAAASWLRNDLGECIRKMALCMYINLVPYHALSKIFVDEVWRIRSHAS
jgi:hypothetical protein